MQILPDNVGISLFAVRRRFTPFISVLRTDSRLAIADSTLTTAIQHHRNGELEKASQIYRQILRVDPRQAETLDLLGVLALQQQEPEEAVQCFQAATESNPSQARFHHHLGSALLQLARIEEAVAAFEYAIELDPADIEAMNQLACLKFRHGEMDEAAALFKRALEADPQSIASWLNLGSAFVASKQLAESEECFRRVTQIDENNTDAWLNLSNIFKVQHRVEEAAATYREATRRLPTHPLSDLWPATLCPAVFPSNAAIDGYRASLKATICNFSERKTSFTLDDIGANASVPPINLQFHGRSDRELLEAYARIFRDSIPPIKPGQRREGRPRVGFIVTSGHETIFLRFLGGILNRLPSNDLECVVICHETGIATLRQQLDIEVIQLLSIPYNFKLAVETIERVGFDVLYHWETGTDVTNYFLPFCRLAPVQCTSLGNSGTSGNAAIDYFISSRLYEPDNAEAHYTEKLVLLDGLGSLHSRAALPNTFRHRDSFGFSASQHVYVCAQKLQKIHPDFDPLLASILRGDSHAIVLLIESEYPAVGELLRHRFQTSMSDVAERVQFIPKLSFDNYLSLLGAADVLLDPLHYGGGLTMYDAISLNRPVVTLPGEYARGRYAHGLYQRMGVNRLVADSPEHYVELAVSLASEPDFRESVESEIRDCSGSVFDDFNSVTEYEIIFEQFVAEARAA